MSVGSVRRDAGGTWSFTVDVAPIGSRRRQIHRRGFRTQREAAATMAVARVTERTAVPRGRSLPAGGLLCAWLGGEWEGSIVYFVRRRSDGHVKIGLTQSPWTRLRVLRQEYGPLEILAFVEGTRADEEHWHRRFSWARTGEGLEWFDSPEVVAAARSLARGVDS